MEKIENIITNLDEFILARKEFDSTNISLLGGLGGVVYYCFASSNEQLRDKGYELLEVLIDNITSTPINQYSYANGICGILYLFNFLKENGYIEDEIENFVRPIENHILGKVIPSDYTLDNKDFLYGIFGYLHYFSSKPSSAYNEKIVTDLVHRLLKTSLRNQYGVYFTNNQYNKEKISFSSDSDRRVKSDTSINFGLAHGNLAIGMIFLDIIEKYPTLSFLKEKIIAPLANIYIQNMNLENLQHKKSIFPTFLIKDDQKVYNDIPLAWCYGDLSIAIFLYQTFLTTGNIEYRNIALEIGEKHVHHTDPSDQELDPYYCHGYAGIAAQYESLYTLTMFNKFKEASYNWQKRVFLGIQDEINETGTCNLLFEKKLDLLNGVLGVALSFNPSSHPWKKIFLN